MIMLVRFYLMRIELVSESHKTNKGDVINMFTFRIPTKS